jgi:hypothetical protein
MMHEVTRDDVLSACREAYQAQSYKDNIDLHEAVFEIVEKAVVKDKKDRTTKMVPRGVLMSRAFPLVPGAAEWMEQDDPELATLTYKELDKRVWASCGVLSGPIQKMFGERNGSVLLRVGGPWARDTGVYVTSDKECLRLDFYDHMRAARVRQAAKDGEFNAEITRRIPALEQFIADMFEDQLRATLSEGRNHLRLLAGKDNKK